MRLFTRMTVLAAAAMVMSAVLFNLANEWFGEDTSILGAGRQIVLEARRAEALRARAEMVVHSLNTKRDIIAELVAGRLSYRQAVVRFHKANDLVENLDLDLIPAYQSPTNPEGVGRQVFVWARNAVVSWPSDKSKRFLMALENEFQTMFHGAKLNVEFGGRPMDTDSSGRTEANFDVR